MKKLKGAIKYCVLLVVAVALFVGGFTDNDWMVVQYRFSEWHRINPLWEYAPYFKMNWHKAYMFNILRLIIGAFLLGWLAHWISERE